MRVHTTYLKNACFIVVILILITILLNTERESSLHATTTTLDAPTFYDFAPSRNLRTKAFRVVAAPATGPRYFATIGFDVQFVQGFIDAEKTNKTPRSVWLLGGSSAALRFTAIITSILLKRPQTIRDAVDHFTEMTYHRGDLPETLAPMMAEMINICAPLSLLSGIVNHPKIHLSIMVAHFHPRFIEYPDWKLKLVFAECFLANIVSPSHLNRFFTRTCFYSGTVRPPFFGPDDLVRFVPLTSDNIKQVLKATTCIPFISERVTAIPGCSRGLFFDGALCDFHVNLRVDNERFQMLYLAGEPLSTPIKQTFFDVILPWRKAPSCYFDNCSVIAPSAYFVSQVPGHRLPCVSDWFDKTYMSHPERRKESWGAVACLAMTEWAKYIGMT